ncbi:TPA: aminopeptidase P family protein [Clostridioides difficile]|uniref:Peptidase, M24 family n=5 Tax=Clostridioides difficile TaxID=1496 RepID=Q185D0_CLOD6|nr:aminopeptidase P family protein [Clostridioides difficile]EQF63633.1 metallopeptidase M24 family protein [Clostridioides difficile CD196]EQG60092.1 metallopeptidase M24 family protein [Clostridioides difficile DA00149]EQI34801.1 metallopeptidase M24 family protein [Clostridioides difficile Y184]EQK84216.1 metallopeptidase M24 family protein [Clostridioides difficile CD127]OFU13029.1 peptidase M24 [Clostridium sp. HMSC19D02]OFU34669.1 peptidase M24 [Clostridium sp. HMSC19B04]OFU42619.1 pep
MNIKDRLSGLRKFMEEKNIDAYMIPSSDNHQSEYVGDYFKSREFISGFNGSAGTVIVTKDEAGLWTDGRYFIQAESQLEGSTIKLFKMGQEGCPTTDEYLYKNIPEGGTLGFDGRVISAREGATLAEKLSKKGIKIEYQYDLIDSIWPDRPALSDSKAFLLDVKYCGESFSSKLARLREKMSEKGTSTHVITTLDDIAWLFNIRGGDVKYNPVVLSYAVITLKEVYLFVDESKLNEEILNELAKENVQIKPYNDVYEFVKNIDKTEKVLLDGTKLSYTIYNNIPCEVEKVDEFNPVMFFKAQKNEVELENIRNSHVKDGVAFTKFMYWLKKNVGKMEITEISATQKLEDLRREQEGFFEPSFNTIAAYKEHAAMMHYSATPESNYKLEAEGLFLVDSGGQYYDGTTDITRTTVLGPISDELKLHFTSVARGMINLSKAKFLHGCRGYNLDILSRSCMWNMGIDYQCGTGHGIGFVLNVHEAPNGFRWRVVPERFDSAVLEEGMVTTNEPGIYIEGSHGIRTENEIVVRKAEKNFYGQFMEFEVVTLAPIDLDGIVPELMNKDEKDYLNWYHKLVYDKISPFLTDEEREWLKVYTRAI